MSANQRPVRTVLGVIAVVGAIAGVARWSGVWQRFVDRHFTDGEANPTGRLARLYGRAAPVMNEWLYAIFAKRLDLRGEDEVLDVACGSGAFLRKHAAHARRVAGLDHSADLIQIAIEQNRARVEAGTAEFVVGDATVLPWADGEFSVVTCNCLDCFRSKSKAALAEMYRVLRPGGRLLVADDHREHLESIGFTDVATEKVRWGFLTSGRKG